MGVTPREQYLLDEVTQLKEDLARVTVERDAALAGQLTNAATACRLARELEETTARADVQRLEGTLAEQARALELLTESCKVAKADHDARLAKAIEALKKVDEIACRSGPTIGYGEEPPEPLNPDGCELALLARDAIAALQGEQGPGDWAWVRRPELEAEQKASAALRAHLAAAANTLEALANPKRIDLTDVRIFALERASFTRSALADTNLGADFMPRAELEAALAMSDTHSADLIKLQEQHQAELRRIAEAVREACANCIVKDGNPMVALERIQAVDLDAIVRGGK